MPRRATRKGQLQALKASLWVMKPCEKIEGPSPTDEFRNTLSLSLTRRCTDSRNPPFNCETCCALVSNITERIGAPDC